MSHKLDCKNRFAPKFFGARTNARKPKCEVRGIAKFRDVFACREHLSDEKEPTAVMMKSTWKWPVRHHLGILLRVDVQSIEQLPERKRVDGVSLS